MAGVMSAQGKVQKFKDSDLGVIKEIYQKPKSDPKYLYYIPHDKYTFDNPFDLSRRIDTVAARVGAGRITNLNFLKRVAIKPVDVGSLSCEKAGFVVKKIANVHYNGEKWVVKEDNHENGMDDELISNYFGNLLKYGKLWILRTKVNK